MQYNTEFCYTRSTNRHRKELDNIKIPPKNKFNHTPTQLKNLLMAAQRYEQPAIDKLVLQNLPIRPAAEITITITAATGQPVGIGMIVVGDFVPLVGDTAEWGGVQYGARAEPVTYSYINTDEYGNTTIVRRHAATNMRATVMLPRKYADAALQRLQSVLDQPVACIMSALVRSPGRGGCGDSLAISAISASRKASSFAQSVIASPFRYNP